MTQGCFCSLSCAAAANLADNKVSMTTRGERHSLITMMHAKMDDIRRLRVAPDRECLRIYGGSLNIHDFRHAGASTYKVMHPPMRPFAVYQTRCKKYDKMSDAIKECKNNIEPWILDIDKFDTDISENARSGKGLGKFMTVSFTNNKNK